MNILRKERILLRIHKVQLTAYTFCFVHCCLIPIIFTIIPYFIFLPVALNLPCSLLILLSLSFNIASLCLGSVQRKLFNTPFLISLAFYLSYMILHYSHLYAYISFMPIIAAHLLSCFLCKKCPKCDISHLN
jgi:hypothetical protein